MTRRWIFLTDTEPAPTTADPGADVSALLAAPPPVAPRTWFSTANALGFTLAASGAPDRAAGLMESSIGIANRLAARDPDCVEFGVEACLNRIDLLRRTDPAAAAHAYRACYDAVQGRPASRRLLFGLDLARVNSARLGAARRCLAVLRYRSQAALLQHHLATGDTAGALGFAAEVVADFPRSVQAGMLQSAEVLATFDPRAAFLDRFDVRSPRTEGDFVVLLRLLAVAAVPYGDAGEFATALARFTEGAVLRNPRTPLLWSAWHAVVTGRNPDRPVQEALAACRHAADRRLYDAVAEVARDHLDVPAFPAPARPTADPAQADLVAEFSALGDTLCGERDVA